MDAHPWIRSLTSAALVALLVVVGLRTCGKPGDPLLPTEPTPPTEPTAPPAEPKPDPLAAIVRISRSGVGCSATVIGPRRVDGRYWVLTAAHCQQAIGQRWTMQFRDGRREGMQIVNMDPRSDCAWGLTDANATIMPYALLADQSPDVGASIWHAGFGVDIPGNREEGRVTGGPDQNHQIRFRISVSSGDSGGGFVHTPDGKVVSCVCCTTGRGQVADVWGASTEAIRRTQTERVDVDEWTPLPIPERMPPKP